MSFGGAGHSGNQIFLAPGAKSPHYAAELCTLSVTDPSCDSALTDTTENLAEKRGTKLTDLHSHPEKMTPR